MGDDTVSTPDGSQVEVEVYNVSLGFFGKIRKVNQLAKRKHSQWIPVCIS